MIGEMWDLIAAAVYSLRDKLLIVHRVLPKVAQLLSFLPFYHKEAVIPIHAQTQTIVHYEHNTASAKQLRATQLYEVIEYKGFAEKYKFEMHCFKGDTTKQNMVDNHKLHVATCRTVVIAEDEVVCIIAKRRIRDRGPCRTHVLCFVVFVLPLMC